MKTCSVMRSVNPPRLLRAALLLSLVLESVAGVRCSTAVPRGVDSSALPRPPDEEALLVSLLSCADIGTYSALR